MRERKAGKVLKNMRDLAGLSQTELGGQVGYSGRFVGLLESGAKFPASNDIIQALALACGCDPGELIAAYDHDRAARWLSNRPEHIPLETAAKLSAILDHEPVAA